ncbi:MAG: hydroxysqualene dehydroxylase HpnE [Nitrospinota bacterium]
MRKSVLILGGGVAGLSAAAALAEAGVPVTVVEKRPRLGGRASSFFHRGMGEPVDNGPHLLMACYRELRRFLSRVGAEGEVEFQPALRVPFLEAGGRSSLLEFGPSANPLDLAWRVLRWAGPSLVDRWRLVRGLRRLLRDPALPEGESAGALLARLGQGGGPRRWFWDPLVQAVLNETPERADGKLLARTLQEAFREGGRGAALGFARAPLGELLGERARRFVESRGGGGRVRTGAAARTLWLEGGEVRGAILGDGSRAEAGATLAALPPPALFSLLPGGARGGEPFFAGLSRLSPSPIVSVYLWPKERLEAPPFTALVGGQFHWLFDAGRLGGRGSGPWALLASTAAGHLARGNEELAEEARRELARALGLAVPFSLEGACVVREREATWGNAVGEGRFRPGPVTPLRGLFLAGDWTDTRLPATLESAARSGHRAAKVLLEGV